RMLEMALHLDGPVAVRFPRDNAPSDELIHRSERREMTPGRAEVLREGGELAIWAYGALVNQALEAAERCSRRGVPIGVVDARFAPAAGAAGFAKPRDLECRARTAQSCRWILTLEEHQRAGGFGSAVLEALSQLPSGGARVKVLAVPDRFVDHRSTREEQLAE